MFFQEVGFEDREIEYGAFCAKNKRNLVGYSRRRAKPTKYEAQKFRAKLIYVAPGAVFCYELA